MKDKIAIIVQRYGLDIHGGAEYHARMVAELLRDYYEVEVYCSSALDYITWEKHYDKDEEIINGIKVFRFDVLKERSLKRFAEISDKIFNDEHLFLDEEKWLEEEGPYMPNLIDRLEEKQHEYKYMLFFSYRYYQSYHGVKRFQDKAILIPTAEHDNVIYMKIFRDFFHLPKAVIFNTFEEKELIEKLSNKPINCYKDIVGVGSEIPQTWNNENFRQKYDIKGDYFLYIGRIDENKGAKELFDFYKQYLRDGGQSSLLLIGRSLLPIPENEKIKHLGFLDNQDKFDALSGAKALLIPSQYESLSIVALEAWALGKMVVVNGNTEVLVGQSKRSNAGLWYKNYDEFAKILFLLDKDKKLNEILGKNGEIFFRENYSPQIIKDKYLKAFKAIEKE